MPVIGASTGWDIGLVLGIVVVAVAAAIVITIVILAKRIAGQAGPRSQGVDKVRAADRRARRDRPDQRLRGEDPALRAGAAKGGGRQMTAFATLSNHGAWAIALVIGLVAALVVAGLLVVLVTTVDDIDKSVDGAARRRGQGRRQHRQHPAARGDRARARA